MSCILRISGRDFDVDEFLKTTGFTPVRVFRKGDPTCSTESGVQEESGCNIKISSADFDEFERQKEDALKCLTDQFEQVELFRKYQGESADIDFGIRTRFIEEEVYVHTDFLLPELLLVTGKLGIGIALSYYWTKAENKPDTKDQNNSP